MNKKVHPSQDTDDLPRREREALEAVYALERASVRDVQQQLAGEPAYSATRMLLQRLHKKKLLNVKRDGARYIYVPIASASMMGQNALSRVVNTFFGGSSRQAFGSYFSSEGVSSGELDELEELIRETKRKRGRT